MILTDLMICPQLDTFRILNYNLFLYFAIECDNVYSVKNKFDRAFNKKESISFLNEYLARNAILDPCLCLKVTSDLADNREVFNCLRR